MKLFLVLMVFCSGAMAEGQKLEYVPIKKISAEVYNSILKRRISTTITTTATVNTDADNSLVETDICIISAIYETCFYFKPETMSKLSELIGKYNEWKAKATKNKDSFQKEIGAVEVNRGVFYIGKNLHTGTPDPETVSLTFFSTSKTNHMLVIDFPKMFSGKNKFTTSQPESVYFNAASAKALLEALSDSFLKTKVDSFLKKKAKTNSEYK